MKILDFEQGTPEWLAARAGRVTASRVQDGVLSKARNGKGESAGRRNYRAQIACSILTGRPARDTFKSYATEEGLAQEPFARASYEILRNVLVDQVGFIIHPTMDRVGCSPDGLVGTDGMMQIKAPYAATHIEWLMDGVVPPEHLSQMHLEIACCERKWSDFVSYCPDLPEHLRLFVCRLPRDDARIAEMEAEVKLFLAEVDELLDRLAKLGANELREAA